MSAKAFNTAATLLFCVAAGPAAAQSTGTPLPGSSSTAPEQTAPGTALRNKLDQKAGTLSDKLSDTNGVIKPTGNVDPDMHVPTPQKGITPVINPGAVGGDTAK